MRRAPATVVVSRRLCQPSAQPHLGGATFPATSERHSGAWYEILDNGGKLITCGDPEEVDGRLLLKNCESGKLRSGEVYSLRAPGIGRPLEVRVFTLDHHSTTFTYERLDAWPSAFSRSRSLRGTTAQACHVLAS